MAPIPATYDEQGNQLRSIIATDPPDHTPERRLLLPFFAPEGRRAVPGADARAVPPTAARVRRARRGRRCRELRQADPAAVIAEILGIDPSRGNDFAEWVQGVLELGLRDAEVREKYRLIIERFFLDEIAPATVGARRRPDLVPVTAELDGEPVPMHVVRGNISLMLIAGIDTTWSSIGSALWHLAQHPDDRRRLVEEPALIPTAVEELLRAYSPVTMARIATHDTMLGDREVKQGERVLLSFPAANRDPAVFDRPDEVIIDREVNRHVAFGAGIHRCVGSNLARMEMQVAIEEFLAMIPDFELADPDAVTWAGGQVRGPRNLPIRFPRDGRPAATDVATIAPGGGAGADARRADARRRRAGDAAAALRRRRRPARRPRRRRS